MKPFDGNLEPEQDNLQLVPKHAAVTEVECCEWVPKLQLLVLECDAIGCLRIKGSAHRKVQDPVAADALVDEVEEEAVGPDVVLSLESLVVGRRCNGR